MDIQAREIIEAMGGTTRVAIDVDAPTSTVQSWKAQGIPNSRMAHLRLLAEQRGTTIEREVRRWRKDQARKPATDEAA